MKLEVTRAFQGKKEIRLEIKNDEADIVFNGLCYKDSAFLVLEGNLVGRVKVICDSTGEEYFDDMNDELAIKFIHGFYDGFDKNYDIIELDSDTVDLELFLNDEIEGFKLGFHRKDGHSQE